MSRGDHPKGSTLRGKTEGESLFIPCDAPMGRAMRRYLERNTRLLESRERVRNRKRSGK